MPLPLPNQKEKKKKPPDDSFFFLGFLDYFLTRVEKLPLARPPTISWWERRWRRSSRNASRPPLPSHRRCGIEACRGRDGFRSEREREMKVDGVPRLVLDDNDDGDDSTLISFFFSFLFFPRSWSALPASSPPSVACSAPTIKS